MPLPLYPRGKSPRYPFYRRLGGPQSRSGRYGEVKFVYPKGTRTPTLPVRPARSQSLYRLSYPGYLNVGGTSVYYGMRKDSASDEILIYYFARALILSSLESYPSKRTQIFFVAEQMRSHMVEIKQLWISVSVDTFSGDMLTLVKLDRRQMGAYLCIASNDVPPAVSKRITLNINCK
jgi:hypothetical protein